MKKRGLYLVMAVLLLAVLTISAGAAGTDVSAGPCSYRTEKCLKHKYRVEKIEGDIRDIPFSELGSRWKALWEQYGEYHNSLSYFTSMGCNDLTCADPEHCHWCPIVCNDPEHGHSGLEYYRASLYHPTCPCHKD